MVPVIIVDLGVLRILRFHILISRPRLVPWLRGQFVLLEIYLVGWHFYDVGLFYELVLRVRWVS